FGAVPQMGSAATDYPAVRFRLELLVTALNVYFGDWKPGVLGDDGYIARDTTADQRVKFVLPKVALVIERTEDDPIGLPSFSVQSWGSSGFDAPHDLAEGEAVRMDP